MLEGARDVGLTDLIRRSAQLVLQELIEAEATSKIGAGRWERSPERQTHRNGSRPKVLATQAGDVEVRIPKLRQGSFFPSFLAQRRRIDQALGSVIAEAWVKGVSTRKVDDLAQAMGIGSGVSKSEVSRICERLDEFVASFRTRALDHTTFPYVYLDATYLHVREKGLGQVVSKAVVVATGVTGQGGREVLGLDVGDSEDEVFWTAFLRSLKDRGLGGVRLVVSDQHSGLVASINKCFQGAAHQRCRVHFARNLMVLFPKAQQPVAAAAFRTCFAQPTPQNVWDAWERVRDQLATICPKAGPLMDQAKPEVLAFRSFPKAHWTKIWSNNPLERINKEIKRRTRVVGIFPTEASVIRLVGAILADMNDEWQAADRRYLSEDSMRQLTDYHEPVAAITSSDQPTGQ
jgi:transposase-like protein